MKRIVLVVIVIFSIVGCKSRQQNQGKSVDSLPPDKIQFMAALNTLLIYKTTKDYRTNVPIILSDDKLQIISYPHPSDLFFGEKLALPAQLHNGFLLDNRGISKNVAFLKFTYQEYSKLVEAPTLQELYGSIIDNNPLIELWNCGNKANFTDLQISLNEWIDKNELQEKCTRLK